MAKILLRLPDDLTAALDRRSEKEQRSRNTVLVELIRDGLADTPAQTRRRKPRDTQAVRGAASTPGAAAPDEDHFKPDFGSKLRS